MADGPLSSTAFRREREQSWRELEHLVTRLERRGPAGLTAEQALRLPLLYRAALSSLSVARAISLDRNLLTYLQSLVGRAYFCVHGTRGGALGAIGDFFGRQFPDAVRRTSPAIALATLVFFLGIATGFLMTAANEDWFFAFVSQAMAGGRDPDATNEFLLDTIYAFDLEQVGFLKLFASYLFSHNAGIGVMCFALGFAFGVPVFLLVFSNGASLGAFLALYADRGLLLEFAGWLTIHGVTEITAILICAGAGLSLGQVLIFPGRRGRADALAEAGPVAARLAVGAVAMFFIAALLEAFPRQLVVDDTRRLLIAGVTFFLWGLYFLAAGRRRDDGR